MENKPEYNVNETGGESDGDVFDEHIDNIAPDKFLETVQRFEQVEGHLGHIIKLLGVYYKGLIDENIPPQLAGIMVQQYAAMLTVSGY